MANVNTFLRTLILLTPLVVGQPTELVVVRTPLEAPLEKDVAALLNIEQFDSLTLCMRFKFRQYNIFYHQWNLVIDIGHLIAAKTNKCHRDTEDCEVDKKSKLGETIGIFLYYSKKEMFEAWVPGEWSSLCILKDKPRLYYAAFLGDKKRLESHKSSGKYTSPIVLLNHAKCRCTPMDGSITDLNVWDFMLEEEAVVNWTRCGGYKGGNIIDWRRGNLDTEKEVLSWNNASLELIKLETTTMSMEVICPNNSPKLKEKKLKTFEISRDYQGNIDFCHNIGGQLAVARDNQTLMEIVSAVAEVGLERCKNFFYIGFSDEEEEDVWRDPDGNSLRWDNWNDGEPNNWDNNEDCAVALREGFKNISSVT